MLHSMIDFLVNTISQFGYFGIFVMMFLESSFFPFPSEIVLIPAGFLIFKTEMNLFMVVLSSSAGSLLGAWLNYLIAYKFGRKVILRFISKSKINRLEEFFTNHGHISTFSGRLIPVIRQYISFPAGLAKMNAIKFSLYTLAGSTIWAIILISVGYFVGDNQLLIKEYMREIIIAMVVFVVSLLAIYIFFKRKKTSKG